MLFTRPADELLALVEGLPAGSRLQASVHGDEFRGYTATVSSIRDLIDVQVRLAAGKKWRKSMLVARPKPRTKVAGGRSIAALARRQSPREIDVTDILPKKG